MYKITIASYRFLKSAIFLIKSFHILSLNTVKVIQLYLEVTFFKHLLDATLL